MVLSSSTTICPSPQSNIWFERMVPAASAPATVKGFTVEPGSKRSVTARLRRALTSKRPGELGSKVG